MPNNDEILQETHDMVRDLKVVLLGIPGTEDKGIAGEIKDINDHLKTQNSTLIKHSISIEKINTTVNGSPDNLSDGLIGRVNSQEQEQKKSSKMVWVLIGSLIASGGLGAGISKLLEAIK